MRDIFQSPVRSRLPGTRKWDDLVSLFGRDDLAPYWIADMDFRVPDSVTRVLSDAVNQGIFAYPNLVGQCREAAAGWLYRRHAFAVPPESVCFMPRVVGGIVIAIHCFTRPGDGIVVQTPVYRPLQNTVKDNGRVLLRNPLRFENGHYRMDLDQLEDLFAKGAKVLLLCSPHNPVGRVWAREELLSLAALCARYGVLVFSDEIHQDLVYSDAKHSMLATLSEDMAGRVITFIAPTKAFNLAGLMASAAVVPSGDMLRRYEKALRSFDVQVNQLGQLALCAAYKEGDAWLECLLAYLEENRAAAEDCMRQEETVLFMVHPEGTYLYWLDLRRSGLPADQIMNRLACAAKVAVYDGRFFGPEGAGFIRFNAACSKETMLEGLERIKRAF
jgi:cystathionine beta-lyase